MVKEQDVPIQNFPTGGEITDDVIPEIPVEEEKVIYYNPITGLETTEELFNLAPLAYVMEKNSPLFGLSGADIIIDIPNIPGLQGGDNGGTNNDIVIGGSTGDDDGDI
jgi:hypothetical protein